MDLVRRHALEGVTLHTHDYLKRKAPDLLICDSLLPARVLHATGVHDGEFVVLFRLDNTVEAVHTLASVVLGVLELVELLIADEDTLLVHLGLGSLLGSLLG